ncbi:MAG: S8 family serine peptidase [Cyanobacteria bacterium REEB65]|nr:S8 family serine peptidase [Cyanobacteria bacterium REEB65]
MKAKSLVLPVAVTLTIAAAGCFARSPGQVLVPGQNTLEISHQVIVGFKTPAEPDTLSGGTVGLARIASLAADPPVAVYEMPTAAPVPQVVAALRRQPNIRWVEENQIQTTSQFPDDPDFWRQWALSNEFLNPLPIWRRNIDASKITIAVLDTGIDPYHPEFAGRVLMGLNALTQKNDSEDDDGHGTHVAGILGAAGNNGIGVAGICWQCKLLAVKVLGKDGGNDAEALEGLKYAVDNGAKVINMSFNSEDKSVSAAYSAFVDYALSKNAVVVAAGGNDGGAVTQPATTPGIVAVAATDEDDRLATYSNRGPQIGIAAPGDDILSTFIGESYKADTGTSMAAPFVSGAAALLFAEHPGWSAKQVISALEGATDPIVSLADPTAHYGRLNLSRLP